MSNLGNIDSRPRPPKRRFNGRPRNMEDTYIEEWLQYLEEENSFSDVDDSVEDPDFTTDERVENLENEGNRESQEDIREPNESDASEGTDSEDEDERPLSSFSTQEQGRAVFNYIGKNGFLWSKTAINRSSRTPAHNIIHVSRPTEPLVFQSFMDLWSKLFDSDMIMTIVINTNQKLKMYREQFRNTDRSELKDTDDKEMRSFLGLLYYSSVFKCNNADANYLFATDGTGHEIFRCVMSKYRFCTLLNCLRFDNAADRQERLKINPLAAVSCIFEKLVANSQKNYTLGPNTCIDEMLVAFRGRCKFIVYMPKKPAKYGIKIMILSDADTYYTYNAYIYCGKNSDGVSLPDTERNLGVSTQSVLRLAKPIENTNRNITADNWFSSIQLMEILRSKGLTYLGTLRKNKREVPPEFQPNRKRDLGSALYGFTKDYTIVSYVPKINKAVILVSSSHHAPNTDEVTNKPTMIVDYNHTKAGVDEIDKKCSIYSCTRKTRRWPMAIFFRMLDLAGVNAFVLYQGSPGAKLRRGDFLLSLARELALPSVKERVYNDRLPRELRLTIRRVLGKDLPPPPQPPPHLDRQQEDYVAYAPAD